MLLLTEYVRLWRLCSLPTEHVRLGRGTQKSFWVKCDVVFICTSLGFHSCLCSYKSGEMSQSGLAHSCLKLFS